MRVCHRDCVVRVVYMYQYSSVYVIGAIMLLWRTVETFVRLALKVSMENYRDLVDVILL